MELCGAEWLQLLCKPPWCTHLHHFGEASHSACSQTNSSSCCWRQGVLNQPWGGQVSSGRDGFKQSQQTNIWPESLLFTPLVTEGLKNNYWKAMFLHFNVQEYIHKQFAVEDPKSPTQEHHPYTQLPWTGPCYSQYRIATLGYREGANPTPHWMEVNLTKPKDREFTFLQAFLRSPVGDASSSSCAPAWRGTKGLHPVAS